MDNNNINLITNILKRLFNILFYILHCSFLVIGTIFPRACRKAINYPHISSIGCLIKYHTGQSRLLHANTILQFPSLGIQIKLNMTFDHSSPVIYPNILLVSDIVYLPLHISMYNLNCLTCFDLKATQIK